MSKVGAAHSLTLRLEELFLVGDMTPVIASNIRDVIGELGDIDTDEARMLAGSSEERLLSREEAVFDKLEMRFVELMVGKDLSQIELDELKRITNRLNNHI